MIAEGMLKLKDVEAYLLSGKATMTLVSLKTGDRKTYRVRAAPKSAHAAKVAGPANDNSGGWFVDLLVGSDNREDYKYLAFLFRGRGGDLRLKPNRELWGEEAFKAFGWLVQRIWRINGPESLGEEKEQSLFEGQAEVWHLGQCGRCGRDLTDPQSIALGLGPTCAEKES